jgi:hypothetical protein
MYKTDHFTMRIIYCLLTIRLTPTLYLTTRYRFQFETNSAIKTKAIQVQVQK